MVRVLTLLLIISVSLFGCDRPVDGKSTRIRIQAPEAYGKVGALSTPAGRKACYGVSISGEGINGTPASNCSPQTGQVVGFVEAGKEIQASVNKGSGRKVELYVLLKAAGDNTACPSMTGAFSAHQLLNTYLVGSVSNLNLDSDEVVVEITASFPGEANHLAAQMALPATCTASIQQSYRSGFRVTAGRETLTGTGLILKARAGSTLESKELTGTGYILKVK